MSRLAEWIRRFWGSLRRSPTDRELEQELAVHLAIEGDERRRRGMPTTEAERAARLAAGGVAQTMEALRDQRGLPWLDSLVRDVRHVLRTLGHSPGFTAVALVMLALGIGANAGIFSIVYRVLLRPLPYSNPSQLMFLTTRFPAQGFSKFWVSPPEYFEFREMNHSFSDVGAFTVGYANVTTADRPRRVRSAAVDEHLLQSLGIHAQQGRVFRDGESEVASASGAGQLVSPPATVILSYELWHSAYGGQPMVGRTIDVNGRPCEVLGVMPPGTDVTDNRTELWLPLGLNPADRQSRGIHYLYLIGRLKDGVTMTQAQDEVARLMDGWSARAGLGAAEHAFVPISAGANGHVLQMKPLQEEIVGGASSSIWILQAAAMLVLLIACVNLASLVIARAEGRRREFAVRTALGASRAQVLRLSIIEGLVLSIAGGTAGLWLASIGLRALLSAYPVSLPRTNEVRVDMPVLVFTLCTSIAAGVLCGLAPFAHTRARSIAVALRERTTSGAGGTGGHRLRPALVMVEIALAVVLATASGLLLRTLYNLSQVDAGFDRSHLVTFSLTLPPGSYPQGPDQARTYERVLAQLRGTPGVQGATAMSGLPPLRAVNANGTQIGDPPAPGAPVPNIDYYQNVMTDYFETMGIPIVLGRGFQPADAGSTGMVAVINETLASKFWKGQSPLGQRLRPCCAADGPWFTVVGVAKDVKQGGLDRPAGTELYRLVEQLAAAPPRFVLVPVTMNVVARTSLPPSTIFAAIEGIIRNVDRSVPIAQLREMTTVFDESMTRPKLLAQLVGAFAGLALLLAATGTYGVLSYIVAQRRREIGIRIALGADRGSVLVQIVKQGFVLALAGAVVGVAGSLAANRLLESLLFGVQPTDLPTLLMVVAMVMFIAVAASGLPAWRASRQDPSLVLRED